MRSRTLIIVALGASLAACATPEAKAVCYPVSGWASPSIRCGGAAAATATGTDKAGTDKAGTDKAGTETPTNPSVAVTPPETTKPEPEPEPTPPVAKVKVVVKGGRIEVSEPVEFETDSAVLLDRSKSVLDQVAQAIDDHPEVKKVQIEGYTDAGKSKKASQKLSDQRVASVKSYLVGKGVEAKRLKTKGFGQTHPLGSNKTEEGRAQNRRIEFKVLKK